MDRWLVGVSQKAMDVFKQLDFEGDGVVAYDDFKSGNWLTYNDFWFCMDKWECGKEGNVLFNDALNTFYLRLYGVGHLVKYHSDTIVRGNPLPPHGLLFPISRDRIAIPTAFVTPVVEHWLEREIAQWVHPMKDRSDDPSHHERTLLPRSYISLPECGRHQ